MSLSEHKKCLVVPVPRLVVSCSITVENLSTGRFRINGNFSNWKRVGREQRRSWKNTDVKQTRVFFSNGFGNKLCYRGKFTDSPIEKQWAFLSIFTIALTMYLFIANSAARNCHISLILSSVSKQLWINWNLNDKSFCNNMIINFCKISLLPCSLWLDQ